jgi:hypothetical protein
MTQGARCDLTIVTAVPARATFARPPYEFTSDLGQRPAAHPHDEAVARSTSGLPIQKCQAVLEISAMGQSFYLTHTQTKH